MLTVFDYIFYRTASFYRNSDKHHTTAIAVVCLLQILFLVSLTTLTMRIFYDRSITRNFVFEGKVIIFILLGICAIYNFRKYDHAYETYHTRWQNESNKVLKGWGVFVIIILFFLPLIIMGTYF